MNLKFQFECYDMKEEKKLLRKVASIIFSLMAMLRLMQIMSFLGIYALISARFCCLKELGNQNLVLDNLIINLEREYIQMGY